MLLIYSETSTPRFEYILSELLNAAGAESFKIITDRDEFISTDVPKINYSPLSLATKELLIVPHTLLFENSINEQVTEPGEWNGLKCFFYSGLGNVPFDIFAASFYLLSRYEEYLDYRPDKFGRYPHKNSLAFRHLFLHLPLINLWLKELVQLLNQEWPSLSFKQSAFRFLPTYDVDTAFKIKGEDTLRQLLITGKALASKGIDGAKKYNDVINGKANDPF